MPRQRKGNCQESENQKKKGKHIQYEKVQTLAREVTEIEKQLRTLDIYVPDETPKNSLTVFIHDSSADDSDDIDYKCCQKPVSTSPRSSLSKREKVWKGDENTPLLGHVKGNTKVQRKKIKRTQERYLFERVTYLRGCLAQVLVERNDENEFGSK